MSDMLDKQSCKRLPGGDVEDWVLCNANPRIWSGPEGSSHKWSFACAAGLPGLSRHFAYKPYADNQPCSMSEHRYAAFLFAGYIHVENK